MHNKKLIGLMLATTLLASTILAACTGDSGSSTSPADSSSAGSSQGASSAPDAAPVEIRVAWWGDTNRHELYNRILDEFEKEYPNVTCVP